MKSYLKKIPIPVRRVVVLYIFGDKAWIGTAKRSGAFWSMDRWKEVFFQGHESPGSIGEEVAEFVKGDRRALIVVISREFYNSIRAIYPAGLIDHIQRVIEYERQEHTLHKGSDDLMIYKNSRPIVSDQADSILAHILWAEKSSYERFLQLFPMNSFSSWTVLPDSLFVEAFAQGVGLREGWVVIPCGSDLFGAYHVGEGLITESALIGSDGSLSRSLFLRKISTAQKVICVSEGCVKAKADVVDPREFFETALRGLLTRTRLFGFEGTVRLGLPRIPRSLLPLAVLLMIVVGSGFLMDYRLGMAEKKLDHLLKERQNLENQWKPLEADLKAIERLSEERNTLERIMKQNIPVRGLFAKLSEITPDNTWLMYFDLSGGNTVMLRGESGSALEYVSILSKVPGFKDVGFAAPVRKDDRTGKETFDIRFVVDWDEFRKAGN